jgi:protein TonB
MGAAVFSRRGWMVTLLLAIAVHLLAIAVWQGWLSPENSSIKTKVMALKITQGGEVFVARDHAPIPERAEALSALDPVMEPEPLPEAMDASPSIAQAEPSATAHPVVGGMVEQVPAALQHLEAPVSKPQAPPAPKAPARPVSRAATRAPSPSPAATASKSLEAPQSAASATGGKRVAIPAAPGSAGARVAEPRADERTRAIARVVERYEQLLSAWVQQHQRMPEYARKQGLSGSALVRIRIDRRGNILFNRLERRTGQAILDRAVMDMIARANPVPAVPAEYPAGSQFEFLIPVHFRAN